MFCTRREILLCLIQTLRDQIEQLKEQQQKGWTNDRCEEISELSRQVRQVFKEFQNLRGSHGMLKYSRVFIPSSKDRK
jgi:site-specific DNA-adenine methylase